MKTAAAMDPELRALLDRREARGLRNSILIALGLMVFGLVGSVTTDDSSWLVGAFALLYVGVAAVLLLALRRLGEARHLLARGLAMMSMALLNLATIPTLWYLSVGGAATPASYLLKTIVPQFCILMIILVSLPGRPLWPAIATLASLAAIGAHLALALADPRSAFTTDYREAIFGPPVSRGLVVSNMLYVLESGTLCFLLCLGSRRTIVEAVSLKATNARLSRYFSPAVARELATEGSAFFAPGGRVQEVVVLFADIRSFTSLAESMEPGEVLSFLADYHQRMVDALFRHGGTLDKFIGDGIMATFGTPRPGPDDADRALRAGLEMKRELAALNADRAGRGLPPVGQGIGIHAGPAIVGNIGTRERLEYTVIGDTVNVASRLESACKETGRDFLVSGGLRARLGDTRGLEALGAIEVKGRSGTIEAFAVRAEG